MSHELRRRARGRVSAAIVVLAVVCAASAFLAVPAMAAPPSNDLIENATVIDPLPFTSTVSTAEATKSASDPVTSCGSPNLSVWYRYDATVSQVLRLTPSSSTFSHTLAAFQGTPSQSTLVGCWNGGSLSVAVTAGQTYYFMGSTSGPPGTFTLNAQLATPPGNDLLANATPITLPFTVTQSTQDATREATDPACGPDGPNIWFRYDASATTLLRTTISSPSGFAEVGVFEGGPGSWSPVACFSASQLVPVTAGHTYFLMVNSGPSTSMTLDVQLATPPANDLIENATLIPSLPFTTSQSTQDATKSPTDPVDSAASNSPSIWFRYDSPSTTLLRITVSGGMGPFPVGVYDGAPGSLTPVTCASAPLLAPVTAGHTYYLKVATGLPATMTVSVQVATPPANDLIGNATPIPSLPFVGQQTTQDATRSASDPTATCSATVPNVWFRYDASSTQLLRATIASTSGVPVAVFQGAPGSLTQIACGGGEQLVQVTAGQSYYFMVSTAFVSGIRLSLQVATPPANDLIENATPIVSLPFSTPQSTQDATRSPADPSATCLGVTTTVWFRYDAPATQLVRVTPTPSFFSGGIVVYRGMPGSLTQVACGFSAPQQIVVTEGETYYIMIGMFSTANITLAVTLLDTAPTLTVPADITVPATGPDGATVEYTATATDGAAPAPAINCAPPSGNTFPVGDTVVHCTATDSSGLTDQGTFTVHVTDTTPPELSLPGTVTADATSATGATVDYSVGATDNADPDPLVVCGPASGGMFAVGNTVVHCTATDASGNTSAGDFTVHVNSAGEQVANLRALVDASTTGGLRSSLGSTLQDAAAGVASGNASKACGALTDFLGLVKAQSGKGLTVSLAAQLTTNATRIKNVIGCKK